MKITDLKEGDVLDVIKPYSDRLVQFTVVRNIVDGVLVLFNESNDKYLHIVSNSMSGGTELEQKTNINKIISKVVKEVAIDKQFTS